MARARRARVNYRFIFMKPSGNELEQIGNLLTMGVIRPVVDRVFPISECQSAMDYSESGRARGKIIIGVAD